MITNANGKADENFYFRLGENTSVYQSCSMMFKNQFYIFGGEILYGGDNRQISRLSECHLQRVGTLDFTHHAGACTAVSDTKVYLCFDWISGRNKCRYADDPLNTFTEAGSSVYSHAVTNIAASNCE